MSETEEESLRIQVAGLEHVAADLKAERDRLRSALERMLDESRGYGEPDEVVLHIPHTTFCLRNECRYCQARAALGEVGT